MKQIAYFVTFLLLVSIWCLPKSSVSLFTFVNSKYKICIIANVKQTLIKKIVACTHKTFNNKEKVSIKSERIILITLLCFLRGTASCTSFHLIVLGTNRPYPVIWKTVPPRINILKLHQVNFCIENITLSKFQGDTRKSFPDIAFRMYINSYEKLAICTWVGTKYCILPTLSKRVLYLKHCNFNQIQYSWMKLGIDMSQ